VPRWAMLRIRDGWAERSASATHTTVIMATSCTRRITEVTSDLRESLVFGRDSTHRRAPRYS
jgi:hypothetical protein